MKFSKYNNPNRKNRGRKKLSRTDADILTTKNMIDDKERGIELPLPFYDAQSDRMCGKPSRHIY